MPKVKSAIESIAAFSALANARRRKDYIRTEDIASIALQFSLIRALQVREEMVQFLRLVENARPRRVLEIGTCRGGTLFSLCFVCQPDAKIVSIDLPNGPFGGGYGWLRVPIFHMFATGAQRLHLIRDDSHSQGTMDRVNAILCTEQLDLLFIDGDHTYAGVKRDFEMYSPLVAKGGVVAFHDIVEHPPGSGCEVSRFWNEVRKQRKSLEIVKDWHQRWGGIGVLQW
jgi:predicted O-methyltransferase YrrM